MCYGNPAELLAKIVDGRALTTNVVGHTVLDDFRTLLRLLGLRSGKLVGETRLRQRAVAGGRR